MNILNSLSFFFLTGVLFTGDQDGDCKVPRWVQIFEAAEEIRKRQWGEEGLFKELTQSDRSPEAIENLVQEQLIEPLENMHTRLDALVRIERFLMRWDGSEGHHSEWIESLSYKLESIEIPGNDFSSIHYRVKLGDIQRVVERVKLGQRLPRQEGEAVLQFLPMRPLRQLMAENNGQILEIFNRKIQTGVRRNGGKAISSVGLKQMLSKHKVILLRGSQAGEIGELPLLVMGTREIHGELVAYQVVELREGSSAEDLRIEERSLQEMQKILQRSDLSLFVQRTPPSSRIEVVIWPPEVDPERFLIEISD